MRRRPEQQDLHPLRCRKTGTGCNLGRSEVGAVRVDGDDRHDNPEGLLAVIVLVVVVVLWRRHDLASCIRPADRANPVGAARTVAARARVERGRGHLVLSAALGRAAMRLLLLRCLHRPASLATPRGRSDRRRMATAGLRSDRNASSRDDRY